ncbi:MAG: ComEC/Rec2 family competence protein [Deltaproteobacteria bacterium]|jgi:ComEC/Rec2-related protein|nr:ComEC/Rec2 family competence protein [Deltaproteobacteria bacterium]MBT4087693.1 ComEC/Rec2 family competence protein [Deltaproteobacteria bacterium]MBT4267195.1 ComEC/Rec2 family competence protein [Deltaproteobacteria bacterium]MBT4638042.1 ComEC/Rec2 family competence protein [Deltaproteobacteria bacterium]MBT6499225.1 ComEC/Rec2 family competence protein [Deltaproteobacteria bacterium]
MERLHNPIVFLILLLLPFFLFFSGWRYWWLYQILLQLGFCLVGLYIFSWRIIALTGLLLLVLFNYPWFHLNSEVPKSCQQQIDHFSGIAESHSFEQSGVLRLIKVELWCQGHSAFWQSAELRYSRLSRKRMGWFQTGDRIHLKNIKIKVRNFFTLDITPERRFSTYNLTYQEKILSRGRFLLYLQNKARYYLGSFPSSLYRSLITADRTTLTDIWKKRISDLGISHLFAISGMHIGILYLWLSLVIRWLFTFPLGWIEKGTGVLVIDLISIILIFMFLKGIGMPISAERSVIMLAWWGLIRHFLKWQPLWFILCGTALLILVEAPLAIGQISFQLSFLSVAGIIQILPFLPRRRLQDRPWGIFLKLIVSSMIISLWLFILTLPLVSQLANNLSPLIAFNNVIHIFFLSFVFLPFALLVMLYTILGYNWGGMPGEIYFYSILNFLGKLWEQMLLINSKWNSFFLLKSFRTWHFLSVLIWIALFCIPFFINQKIQGKRKK